MKTIFLASPGSFNAQSPEVDARFQGLQSTAILRNAPYRDSGISVQKFDALFLHKVQTVILDHLREDLRVCELAAALFLSRVQVFRKIKKSTGLSPSRLIQKVRLKKGMELLQTGSHSIADIAYSIGFSDPKYFTRVFAREFGCPPSQLRKILEDSRRM